MKNFQVAFLIIDGSIPAVHVAIGAMSYFPGVSHDKQIDGEYSVDFEHTLQPSLGGLSVDFTCH